VQGVCAEEALKLNEGFFLVIKRARPFVTLKLATSLDGKIADGNGKSKWITSEASRARGHMLRASHDAILTGIGTVLADDPELTCRLPGLENDSPLRIVLDTKLRTPVSAKLLPAWIVTAESESNAAAQALEKAGATILTTNPAELGKVLERLAERGITRLLVEAGNEVASTFVTQGMVDRIYWFRATGIIGQGGLAALKESCDIGRFTLQETQRIGPDILEIYDSKTI
jgi:diaminohydroxyphosphoribosylaminopyrimidine deaminase/5-amino-6-(5-phosphoribosylamino)uracil reductase